MTNSTTEATSKAVDYVARFTRDQFLFLRRRGTPEERQAARALEAELEPVIERVRSRLCTISSEEKPHGMSPAA